MGKSCRSIQLYEGIGHMKLNLAEAKVKAAALGSFVATLALTSWLGTTATDYAASLPDWLEAPALALIASAITFLAGYGKKSNPDAVAPSTRDAVEAWLRNRGVVR